MLLLNGHYRGALTKKRGIPLDSGIEDCKKLSPTITKLLKLSIVLPLMIIIRTKLKGFILKCNFRFLKHQDKRSKEGEEMRARSIAGAGWCSFRAQVQRPRAVALSPYATQ